MSIPSNNAVPWNKGKLVGQKSPLKLKEIWAIRIRLQLSERYRDWRCLIWQSTVSCGDPIWLKSNITDISNGGTVASRAMVMQQKTGRPVQFERTEHTREAIALWKSKFNRRHSEYLFLSRNTVSPHISTRQYARIVASWIAEIGLAPTTYGTHSIRRTKPTLIYKRTHNLRAVQLLLGHTKLESTVRYLGIEVDDALELPSRLKSKGEAIF